MNHPPGVLIFLFTIIIYAWKFTYYGFNRRRFITFFYSLIPSACLIALLDYIKRNKETRKNPKADQIKVEIKHVKPFKQLMNDLLDTEYYKKHKEESIIKQFYT